MSVPDDTATAGGQKQAKKRRRWSTIQDDVAPNRFVGKLRIHGRHPVSNSLASFHSQSNPIFEPSPSVSPEVHRAGAGRFHGQLNDSSGAAEAKNAEEDHHQGARRFRPQKSPEPCLPAEEDGGWRVGDDLMESGSPLPQCQANVDGGPVPESWSSGEERRVEGTLEIVELLPPSSMLAISDVTETASNPPDGTQHYELVSAESFERRSRDLVEKVQAHAAAELHQLRAYKAVIDQLRTNLAKHEIAAKYCAEFHGGVAEQLLSLLDQNCQLQRDRDAQVVAKEDLSRDLAFIEVERNESAAAERDWRLKVEARDEELDAWRKQSERLERERNGLLTSARSNGDAISVELEGELQKPAVEIGQDAVCEEGEAVHHSAADPVVCIDGICQRKNGNSKKEDGSTMPAQELALEFSQVSEVQAQLSVVCDDLIKLEKERDDLRLAVLDAERRVASAQTERDAVVLAVKSEWDAVKVALRDDRERLEDELRTALEKQTKLKEKLASERDRTRELESERDSIAVAMLEAVQTKTDERDALEIEVLRLRALEAKDDPCTAVADDDRRLEAELAEVRGQKMELEREREELIAALADMRDGNKKLECELIDEREEKIKLEREREALIAAREERQKLESERDVVCKATQDENKKLESEREILIAMQAYLKKLEIKRGRAQSNQGGGKKEQPGKRARSHVE